MKRCKKCGLEKSYEDFHKKKEMKDGHASTCKVCILGHEPHKVIREGLKLCKVCNIEKDISQFGWTVCRGYGYTHSYCKQCVNKKRWRKHGHKEEQRLRKRAEKLRLTYGLSLEDYNNLIKAQNGKCAICKEPESAVDAKGRVKFLSVDHCHKTGKIRGLLCQTCNSGLGSFRDRTDLLTNAIDYLLYSCTDKSL